MSITEEAFKQLYPHRTFNYKTKIKYSNKFSDFNANIRVSINNIEIRMSRKWKSISKEIKIGLIQSLLVKVFKTKITTTSIDLYNNFLRELHKTVSKTKTDSLLESCFNVVNENYFFGMIDQPNLTWCNSINKLGSYEYASDTISISTILKEDLDLLNYVMYHELLHKKLKFYTKNNRSFHHTKKFRDKEKEYSDSEEIEKQLEKLVRKHKFSKKRSLWKFF